jgi:capsular exopolysaccharide synthesis family protein
MEPAPLELRDYLSLFWRRKWTIAAVAAVAVGTALLYSFRQTPQYTSSAEVIVRPARFDPRQPRAATGVINMVTEERVANSVPVARRAKEKLGPLGAVSGEVTAALVENSETLDFTAVSPDPAGAQAAAQAWAEAYLELRREQVLGDLEAVRRPLEQEIESIDEELASIAEELAATQDETQQAILGTKTASLLQDRSSALQQLNLLPSVGSIQVGEILQPAGFPSRPSSPNHVAAGGLALVVGLSVGFGMAYLRDRLDPRVRGREELEVYSGAPILAYIPSGRPLKDKLPVTASDPGSELAEAYKGLGLRFVQATAERGTAVVVTSSMAGEGKTSVVSNLGVALAQAGKRVILVSADLRRSGLQRFFPGWDGTGLTEVLSGHQRATAALTRTRIEKLWVLHAGPRLASSSPLELLSSDRMRHTLAELRRLADYILVDTPPLLVALDAAALAGFTDGVLYVADARQASRATVEQARRELELSGAVAIGVVVNRYDPRSFLPYGYRYRYYTDGVKHEPMRSELIAEGRDRSEATPES